METIFLDKKYNFLFKHLLQFCYLSLVCTSKCALPRSNPLKLRRFQKVFAFLQIQFATFYNLLCLQYYTARRNKSGLRNVRSLKIPILFFWNRVKLTVDLNNLDFLFVRDFYLQRSDARVNMNKLQYTQYLEHGSLHYN